MANQRRDLFRLRIELLGIQPPIWREILVPASYSFWDLHVAIQDAMGWEDYHLHEFQVAEPESGQLLRIGIPDDEGFGTGRVTLPGWAVGVIELIEEAGQTFDYDYDFGDGWKHRITLVGVEPRIKGQRYPQCLAGARACPPEDCGGVWGYENLVEALLDPKHPDHEDLRNWVPKGWGPEIFKASDVRFDNPKRRWKLAFGEE